MHAGVRQHMREGYLASKIHRALLPWEVSFCKLPAVHTDSRNFTNQNRNVGRGQVQCTAQICAAWQASAVVADSLWHLSFPGHSALKKPPQVSGSARIRKVGVCTVPRKDPKREVKWVCDVVCACRPPLTPTVSKVPVICRTNHRQFWQRNVERYSAACC